MLGGCKTSQNSELHGVWGLGATRHCDFKGRLTGLLHFETRKKPYYERFIAAAKGPAKTILAITKREHEPWNIFVWGDWIKSYVFFFNKF